MKRDIKFRAWDNVHKRMLLPECNLGMTLEGEISALSWLDDGEFEAGWQGTIYSDGLYELMQYTGLSDRNGKEVYDGDIIKVVRSPFHGERWYGDSPENYTYNENEILVILASRVGYVARCLEDYLRNKDKDLYELAPNGRYGKSPVSNYNLWNYQSWYTVIGNIYENPKLLNIE